MNRIEQVIADLEAARRPSRKLDWAIGSLLGWVLHVEDGIDPKTGNPSRNENWVSPVTGRFAKVPEYSSSLERAIELTVLLNGDEAYAAGVTDRRAKAVVGEDEKSYGATPAIALCIAALRHRLNAR